MTAIKKNSVALSAGHSAPDRSLGRFHGYMMKRAFNVVQEDLTRVLEPFGLRMLSFSALLVVVEHPDITQTQLAQALSVERSNIVVLLDGLQAAGLVNRNPAPNSRRAHALRATSAGQKLAQKALTAVDAHELRLFANCDPQDIAAMRRVFAQIAGS
jgi:DNA-binding MarR family transcriptional regulator